jgi:hypothetical protein
LAALAAAGEPEEEEEDEEEIVGALTAVALPDSTHLLTLVVRADQRRQGVGRALLRECVQRCSAWQQQRIVADVALDNEAAWAFFRQSGFVQGAADGPTAEAVLLLQPGAGIGEPPAPLRRVGSNSGQGSTTVAAVARRSQECSRHNRIARLPTRSAHASARGAGRGHGVEGGRSRWVSRGVLL